MKRVCKLARELVRVNIYPPFCLRGNRFQRASSGLCGERHVSGLNYFITPESTRRNQRWMPYFCSNTKRVHMCVFLWLLLYVRVKSLSFTNMLSTFLSLIRHMYLSGLCAFFLLWQNDLATVSLTNNNYNLSGNLNHFSLKNSGLCWLPGMWWTRFHPKSLRLKPLTNSPLFSFDCVCVHSQASRNAGASLHSGILHGVLCNITLPAYKLVNSLFTICVRLHHASLDLKNFVEQKTRRSLYPPDTSPTLPYTNYKCDF